MKLALNTYALAIASAAVFALTGCTTMSDSQPSSPAMAKRGVMTVVEIESLLKSGLSSVDIMAALERRGGEQVSSEEVEVLRRAGATHALINTLLQVNQPSNYVWVAPPRFSVYFGRSGWYWVDSFGWPVYPQPHSGWYPRSWNYPHPIPIKPTPKQTSDNDKTGSQNSAPAAATSSSPTAPVKPSPRRVEKDVEPSADKQKRDLVPSKNEK